MASILWLPIIFTCASSYLFFLARCIPSLTDDEIPDSLKTGRSNLTTDIVRFPSNMEDLNALAALLTRYSYGHLNYILLLFCSAYIFKQTFAIPGSVFLNILAGALFGIRYGFPLCCVLTAIGATNCYLLSNGFGKRHVIRFFGTQIDQLRSKMEGSSESLFLLILSLRLFPMAPNWLMNMAAPILNVPIHLFFLSVLIGLMPYNFLCVEAGCILSEIRSTSDIFTTATTLKMLAAAGAAFLPGLIIKYFKQAGQRKKKQAVS